MLCMQMRKYSNEDMYMYMYIYIYIYIYFNEDSGDAVFNNI